METPDRDGEEACPELALPPLAWDNGDWPLASEHAGDNMRDAVPMGTNDQSAPPSEWQGERQRTLIEESHQRSRGYGLSAKDEPDFSTQSRAAVNEAVDENKFLYQHAAPVMETLFEQIANTHSMVLLTSAKGLVLHSLGDTDFVEKASRVALLPGFDWSEQSKGTNAVGTALKEEQAVIVHGSQHYLEANKFLTCSCTPIFDPFGQVIGALDVTGDYRSFHQHTMALVRMSAQMIENHMFADIFPKAIRIHFHTRSEFLGTLVEGIAVFSPEGRFLSANRSAQFQLGLSFNALKTHTFSSLFGIPVSRLFELSSTGMPKPHLLYLHNGVSVWCRFKFKQAGQWFNGAGTGASLSFDAEAAPAITPPVAPARVAPPAKPRLSTLKYLDTGDAQVATVIQKLRMVQGRDIPIMILGETGTGKDLLAQAVHGDSARAGQPFVSVNCASIPETLIESELFGYEEGAFTGARKKGATGKIQQANGGTLFLDEIGDMPKQLQARLLRVLQERRVSPLGSNREVDIDVAVVCATHRNLKELIARGDFREDLYYRLNGLVVRLPALRERTDFDLVVQKILATLCDKGQTVTISEDVLALFRGYHWPGNFRQLHNLLRTAVVMVGPTGAIQRIHLPDDFLAELRPVVPTAAVRVDRMGSGVDPAFAYPDASPSLVARDTEGGSLQDVALTAMARVLREHKGNVSAAAKALGVSRNTIYRKKDQLPPDVWG
jgi:transcriptional regulator of acetoin/glycerol metabolism